MDETEIEDFVKDHDIRLVIDATHSICVEVTKNIRAACLNADTQYIRCLREGGKKSDVCEDGEGKILLLPVPCRRQWNISDILREIF